jgi:hypothetical protein
MIGMNIMAFDQFDQKNLKNIYKKEKVWFWENLGIY